MKIFKNKVAKNASWLIGGKIAQSLLGLVVSMLSARYLGPSNFGVLNYAASLVAFAVPITQLGLNSVLVQDLTLHPEEEGKIIGSSILLSLISASFCIVGVFLFTFFVNWGEVDTILVSVLYSLMLVFLAAELIQYWYQTKLLSKYKSIISLVAFLVVSSYKIYLLVTEKSIYWFAVSYSIDYLLLTISLIYAYKRLGGQDFRFSKDVAKRLLSKSKYYIISGLMIVVYAQTDKIMLKLMVGDEITGIYSAAIVAIGLSSFVFTAIIDSFRPTIFNHKKNNDTINYEKGIVRMFSIVIYLALAQSLIMTIFAKFLILLLYGGGYDSSIIILQIAVWYTTFSYLGGAKDVWILAENKQKYLIWINMAGAVMNVLLNFCLIPVIGIIGAAIAALITQIFTNVILLSFFKELRHTILLYFRALNPKIIIQMIKQSFF